MKIGKVLGVLALMDLLDIASKGEFLGWLKLGYPEVAEDWMDRGDVHPILKIRPKMVEKVGDFFANV